MLDTDRFQEAKLYLMRSPGERWSDYEGPYDDIDQAMIGLRELVDPQWAAPETMRGTIVCLFRNGKLDLYRDEGGSRVTGENLYWNASLT